MTSACGSGWVTLSRWLTLRVRSHLFQLFVTSSLVTMRRAARDLLPCLTFLRVELPEGFRALGRSTQRRFQRLHNRASMENEVVDAVNSLARCCQAQAASLPVPLALSCSLNAVADAVAHAGPPPVGLDGPGPFSELRVLEVTDSRVSRSAGRWRSSPAAPWFTADRPWRVGGSQFRLRDSPASQCKVAAKGSASLFEDGAIKFRRTARHHQFLPFGKRMEISASPSTHVSQTQLFKHRILMRLSRDSVLHW